MAEGSGKETGGLQDIILDSISDGVFTVDDEWRITSFNRPAETRSGERMMNEQDLARRMRRYYRSNLRECRLRAGFDNLKELARRTGISRHILRNVEKTGRLLSSHHALRLKDVLRCSLDDLFERSEPLRQCDDWLKTFQSHTRPLGIPNKVGFWTGVFCLGVALGPKTFVKPYRYSPDRIYPNVFSVFIGVSGGAVDVARRFVERLANLPVILPVDVDAQTLLRTLTDEYKIGQRDRFCVILGKGMPRREIWPILYELYDADTKTLTQEASTREGITNPGAALLCEIPAISEFSKEELRDGRLTYRSVFVETRSRPKEMSDLDDRELLERAALEEKLQSDLNVIAGLHGFGVEEGALKLEDNRYLSSWEEDEEEDGLECDWRDYEEEIEILSHFADPLGMSKLAWKLAQALAASAPEDEDDSVICVAKSHMERAIKAVERFKRPPASLKKALHIQGDLGPVRRRLKER